MFMVVSQIHKHDRHKYLEIKRQERKQVPIALGLISNACGKMNSFTYIELKESFL